MTKSFLYEELDALNKFGMLKDTPDIIKTGLSDHIDLREYQKEAFKYFITYLENKKLSKNKQIHTLFHMATGSGKTVIMAGLILYLYTKGYRNFLFFVNQTNILEKTKENFTNPLSSKYLFADNIEYMGQRININSVLNFSGDMINNDINICFTTTQKLHIDLFLPKENSLTYEDFENDKIVFISDESHHVNTLTKNITMSLEEEVRSWEYSVSNAFSRNKEHVLLEFTATADLKDKNVKAKYLNKIIYNYPLLNFRASGYTKDFQNFATDSDLWDRALMAMIMSEYRKYRFADAGLNIKPVIMLKSQRIRDSEEFYDKFFERLKKLSSDELTNFYTSEIDELIDALDYFKDKDKKFNLLVNSLKNGFSKDKTIIMNGASDNTAAQQIQVNSLEDDDNPIRVIFTVDMLNEGWDVLNLFDIVRLYDTRQGGKRISAYTIKEAQLIGRGARYYPFQITEGQERFKRKYDYDLGNENRILETMYFHSRNDSKYISELKQALIATGMEDEEPTKLTYTLKDNFKESEIYRKGYVFSNRRIPKGRGSIKSLEGSQKHKVYYYTKRETVGDIIGLFNDMEAIQRHYNIKTFKFKDIEYHILQGASERYKELKFNVIKEKYPSVKTLKEFLTSDDYLGNNILEVKYYSERVIGRDIYNGLVRAFASIASHIISLKQEFEGSLEFTPKKISTVIKDKSIYLSSLDKSGGVGESQNKNTQEAYQLDLFREAWYVYNDNYGTSEEKLFIKYFKREIQPKLEEKDVKFFLVRNERVPELAIYSFSNGERFEPDFLLFVEKKNIDNRFNYQVYVEPKGGHLLNTDVWKENFLLEIEDKHLIKNTIITANDEYIIMGLPFFNEANKLEDFGGAIKTWFKKI
ncbi:MAG: DEAD/DEAH box helicase family protein [Peptoniphilaceae bacterium]